MSFFDFVVFIKIVHIHKFIIESQLSIIEMTVVD